MASDDALDGNSLKLDTLRRRRRDVHHREQLPLHQELADEAVVGEMVGCLLRLAFMLCPGVFAKHRGVAHAWHRVQAGTAEQHPGMERNEGEEQ